MGKRVEFFFIILSDHPTKSAGIYFLHSLIGIIEDTIKNAIYIGFPVPISMKYGYEIINSILINHINGICQKDMLLKGLDISSVAPIFFSTAARKTLTLGLYKNSKAFPNHVFPFLRKSDCLWKNT